MIVIVPTSHPKHDRLIGDLLSRLAGKPRPVLTDAQKLELFDRMSASHDAYRAKCDADDAIRWKNDADWQAKREQALANYHKE